MALGTSHKCMFPLFEILDYGGMTVLTIKYHRMVLNIFMALFRACFMAIFAFIYGWMDPGFTHRIKQIQRLVRIMTFHASY